MSTSPGNHRLPWCPVRAHTLEFFEITMSVGRFTALQNTVNELKLHGSIKHIFASSKPKRLPTFDHISLTSIRIY